MFGKVNPVFGVAVGAENPVVGEVIPELGAPVTTVVGVPFRIAAWAAGGSPESRPESLALPRHSTMSRASARSPVEEVSGARKLSGPLPP